MVEKALKALAKNKVVNGVMTAGLLTAGCTNVKAPDITPSVLNPDQGHTITLTPEQQNSLKVFNLPFGKDPDMNIQNGWYYSSDGTLHKGIDFIKGPNDVAANWKSFAVMEPADGMACANPDKEQGEAVWTRHDIGGQILYSYMGHVKDIRSDIPQCNTGKAIKVSRGEIVAMAFSSGMDDPTLIHLHFQITWINNGQQMIIDPFDLYGKRDIYPDLSFKNGKGCGRNAVMIECGQVRESQVISQPLLATPLPTIALRDATPVPIITPKLEALTPRTVATLTPIPTSTQEVKIPTSTPNPSTATRVMSTEIPKTPTPTYSQEAILQAKIYFLELINRSQYSSYPPLLELRMNAVKGLEEMKSDKGVEKISQITDSWVYVALMRYSYPRLNESFIVRGYSEIKDINSILLESKNLSPADINNGLQWNGTVKVTFIERYKAIVGPGIISDLPKLPLVESNQYGNWKDEFIDLQLISFKDKWSIKPLQRVRNRWVVWNNSGNQVTEDIQENMFYPQEVLSDCMKRNKDNEKYCNDNVSPLLIPLDSINSFFRGFRLTEILSLGTDLQKKCPKGCIVNDFW